MKKLAVMIFAVLILSACNGQPQTTNQDTTTETVTYTLNDVAEHSTPDDCWIVLHGKVYDVSGFGANHGGGEAVYEGCGIDATDLFETRPMGSGTPHSEQARGYTDNFYIGELSN